MTNKANIKKAGGAIIRDRKFLVNREEGKDVFVAPGGKLDPGETFEQALVRELKEEVSIDCAESDIEHIGTFHANAAGKDNVKLEMKVYLVNNFSGEPTPSDDILEMKWINSAATGLKLGSIFEHDVMPLLKKMDLID